MFHAVVFSYTRAMRLWLLIAFGGLLALLCATQTSAQAALQRPASFPPLAQWKAAVLADNAATLRSLYSTSPPAQISTSAAQLNVDSDISFWTSLRAKSIELQIAQSNSPQPGLQQIVFQARIRTLLRTLYVAEAQLWQQQGGEWKLLSAKRTDATKLEQPLSLDAKIYPAGSDAGEEIHSAVARAAKLHKRVLVVFGADWCYDCHVLDKAFHRQDIAAVVAANYEVVHVDVGQGEKNQDLMHQYDVPMKRGIPAVAVLDASGKLLFSQKNGEFERARALGPEDLLEFLKKWKPQAR
jgi:thioredoxin 1